MGIGAPYGNKNAEKWNYKKAICLFRDAIGLSEQKEYYNVSGKSIEGYSFDFIGEIARELGTFHEIFEHLSKRFPALQRLRNELNNNIQSNCYSNTKKGIIREATGIVNLKSNWKWRDRSDVTSDDKEIKNTFDLSTASTEEILKRVEAMQKMKKDE